MNETRKFPRFLPRPGARISVTFGKPLTSTIEPLVSSWKEMAASEPGEAGIGGEWGANSVMHFRDVEADEEKFVRGRGELYGEREKQMRIDIVAKLQEGVRKLGLEVEEQEGRFENGLWSHSTPWSERRKWS